MESVVEVRDQLYGLLEIQKDTTVSFDLAQKNGDKIRMRTRMTLLVTSNLVNEMHGGP